MKVKNIMFSGVMAAILGATGAHAAISVASQGYVDSKIQGVETSVENITNNYLTKEAAADTYATTQYVTENVTNILGNETDGLVADVAANKGAIESLQTTKANAADVYTKDEADNLLASKADLEDVYLKNETYTQTQVNELICDIQSGGVDLVGYVKESTYNEGMALKADKTVVASDIATALQTAQGYADTAESDAIAAAKDYSDSLAKNYDAAGSAAAVEAKLADYTKTSDLNTTFATDEELGAVDAKFANYTTTEALETQLENYATTTALKAEEDARKAADEVATNALANVYTKEQADAAFDAAGAASDVEAKLKLLATANVPAECQSESNTCVLSMTSDGTFAWTPLTATPTASK